MKMGVLHSFSIKNIFYDKMNLTFFQFDEAIYIHCHIILLGDPSGLGTYKLQVCYKLGGT